MKKYFVRVLAGIRERRFRNRKARLAGAVHFALPDDLLKAEHEIDRLNEEFQCRRAQSTWTPFRPAWEKRDFLKQIFLPQRAYYSEMTLAEIEQILSPAAEPWSEKESALIAQECSYPSSAPTGVSRQCRPFGATPLHLREASFGFDPARIREKDVDHYFAEERARVAQYNARCAQIVSRQAVLLGQIESWNGQEQNRWKYCVDANAKLLDEEMDAFRRHAQRYSRDCIEQKERFGALLSGFRKGKREAVVERTDCILGSFALPSSAPRLWAADFDEQRRILIVESGLPDVVHRPPAKQIQQKDGSIARPLSPSERREFVPKVHPAILLRIGYEIARNDISNVIRLLVLNGWVQYRDPVTGCETRAYTASLMVEPAQLKVLKLKNIDPVAAFEYFKGKSAGKSEEIVPIEPALSLGKPRSEASRAPVSCFAKAHEAGVAG